MEALRNYVQHRGFPIHASEYAGKLIDNQDRNRFRFSLGIYTKTSYLREDGKFKKEVLDELEALGGRVDVKPLVRDYVARLARIQEHLRRTIKRELVAWENTIRTAIDKFNSAFPDEASLSGLAAVRVEGSSRVDPLTLFSEFMDYRRYLEEKNAGYGNLENRYVSGRVVGNDA
jgi:hypothetical protein